MTTTVIGSGGVTGLEELVGRLVDALCWERVPAQVSSVARTVHGARRLRQAGDLDGALAVFASADTSEATEDEARWAHSEWMGLVRRRFGDVMVLIYSPNWGRARCAHSQC